MVNRGRGVEIASCGGSRCVVHMVSFIPVAPILFFHDAICTAGTEAEDRQCDETRPRCGKCLAYGVSCSYDGAKASLDLDATGSFQVDLASSSPSSTFSTGSSSPKSTNNIHLPPPKALVSVNRIAASVIDASLRARALTTGTNDFMAGSPFSYEMASWTFTEKDLSVMKRFQDRTALTIGNSKTAPTYRDCVSQLALTVCPSPAYLNPILHKHG